MVEMLELWSTFVLYKPTKSYDRSSVSASEWLKYRLRMILVIYSLILYKSKQQLGGVCALADYIAKLMFCYLFFASSLGIQQMVS